MKSKLWLSFMLSIVLSACSSYTPLSSNNESSKRDQFMMIYQTWQGTPYQYGGNDRQGIDCSAFVQIAYQEFNDIGSAYAVLPNLKRTTRQQIADSVAVPFSEVEVGDLVFFKTGAKSLHVGIYLGDDQFMHASSSKGVTVSLLSNPYWLRAFLNFRRTIN